jgi:phenylacetate-CoA ligase
MIDLLRTLSLTTLLHHRQFLPAAALEALQRRKLVRLVAYARRYSPFFRRLYRDVSASGFALADLPAVTKSQMIEHFDEYVTDRRLKLALLRAFVSEPRNIGKKYLGYIVFHTSGSSGEPAVIVYDRRGFHHIRAVNLARGMGYRIGLVRALGRLSRPLRIAAVVMDGGLFPGSSGFIHMPRLARFVNDTRVFSLREPIESLFGQLREFRPEILAGYPSILSQLARVELAGGKPLMAETIGDLVVCLGEPLTPAARDVMSRAFICPIADIYGAGECLSIAQSCEVSGAGSGALHVNTDEVILEIVNEAGWPVAPGEAGAKVFVTNLGNFIQPFIRYELTDITTRLAEPCPCGRGLPLISAVSGRTEEILRIGRPGDGTVAIHPFWLVVPFIGFPGIREWQVVQTGRNELSVSYVRKGQASIDPGRVEQALSRSLTDSKVAVPIRWLIREVDSIEPDPATGKVRRIWSRVDQGR